MIQCNVIILTDLTLMQADLFPGSVKFELYKVINPRKEYKFLNLNVNNAFFLPLMRLQETFI